MIQFGRQKTKKGDNQQAGKQGLSENIQNIRKHLFLRQYTPKHSEMLNNQNLAKSVQCARVLISVMRNRC